MNWSSLRDIEEQKERKNKWLIIQHLDHFSIVEDTPKNRETYLPDK